jgi:hypothetical protein
MAKQIREFKCTCDSCGNVWFYGKQEVDANMANALSNAGSNLMCCTGCFPAAFISEKKIVDLDKCPKCNSSAIKKEVITHEIN